MIYYLIFSQPRYLYIFLNHTDSCGTPEGILRQLGQDRESRLLSSNMTGVLRFVSKGYTVSLVGMERLVPTRLLYCIRPR